MSAASAAAVTVLLDDLRKQFGPEVLLDLYARLQPIVTRGEYQRLIVLPSEGNDVQGLQCPHCKSTLANGDSIDIALEVIDVAWRTTGADSVDFENREVTIWYDSHGDYEGLFYQCPHCDEAVRLPEGWREV